MFKGCLTILSNGKIIYKEIVSLSIDNFKPQVIDLFKSNNWDIVEAKFQKSGFGKLHTFDQMQSSDFVFGTVRVFLKLNI